MPGRTQDMDASRGPRRAATVGTTVVTLFGVTAAFISVQNELPKLWNLAAALLGCLLFAIATRLWTSTHQHLRPRRLRQAAAGVGAAGLVVVVAGILLNPTDDPDPSSDPVAGFIGPPPDVRMHEVWEEGANVHTHTLGPEQWAMTEFPVTQPYLRSIEVQVSAAEKVRLVALRRTGPDTWQLVGGDNPTVIDGRAKVIFKQPIDIRADLGGQLYLQALNIERHQIRIFFATRNVAPRVRSYLWCDGPAITCIHRGEDLNAIVYGWSRPA